MKTFLENTSRCVETNGVKKFQIFVYLVCFVATGWTSNARKILNALIFENFDTIRFYTHRNIFRIFILFFNLKNTLNSSLGRFFFKTPVTRGNWSEPFELAFWDEIQIWPVL
jgi:hypothetical protein